MTLANPSAVIRRPGNFTRCKRCGRQVYNANRRRHPTKCDRVPLPVALADEFRGDLLLTLHDLGKKYSVGYEFIKSHLLAAGIPSCDLIRKRKPRGRTTRKVDWTKVSIGPVCVRCTVRLAHLDTPPAKAIDDHCRWCEDEMG